MTQHSRRTARAAFLALGALLLGGAGAQQASEAQLRELVAALVDQARLQTPRRLDAQRTWTGVRADGVEVVYEIALDRDLSPEELSAMRRVQAASDPIAMCADATLAYLVGLGARVRQVYTDAGGDRFETLLDRCPGGAGP